MSLRTQILLGYGLVFLLAGAAIAWAMVNLVRLGAASDAILSDNYRSIEAAEAMGDALDRQDAAVLQLLARTGGAGRRPLEANARRFEQAFADARGNVTEPGEQAVIDSVGAAYDAYEAAFDGAARRGTAVQPTEALYQESLFPRFLAAKAAVVRLREINAAAMEAASASARRVARRAVVSVAAGSGLALALGLGLSLLLAGRIVRPVGRMRVAAARIAAGDLDATIPEERADELGALAVQFNDMTAQMRAYRALNVERIVAEQRKGAAVIESVDDGLVVVRPDLVVDGMNPAAGAALGLDPRAAVGRPLGDVVADARLLDAVAGALAGDERPAAPGGPTPDGAFVDATVGGAVRSYQFAASPVRTPDGSLVGVILVLRDVTGLRELDRLKSEFVATASHELKTPLTSMGMSLGLLQERVAEKLTVRENELLDAAAEDVGRLTALVHDLLDLSKMEAGGLDLDLARTSVAALVERAVRGVRLPAEAAGVALAAAVPEGLPDVVADAARIEWVVTNLLANALRYTDRGGHVTVSAVPAGALVEVSVADDGEGIPVDMQGRIFDRFVQVRSAVGGREWARAGDLPRGRPRARRDDPRRLRSGRGRDIHAARRGRPRLTVWCSAEKLPDVPS